MFNDVLINCSEIAWIGVVPSPISSISLPGGFSLTFQFKKTNGVTFTYPDRTLAMADLKKIEIAVRTILSKVITVV